jgi:hypothetical protein
MVLFPAFTRDRNRLIGRHDNAYQAPRPLPWITR